MENIILHCSLYVGSHQELIFPFFAKYPGHSDVFNLRMLLSDQFNLISMTTAKYYSIVCTLQCRIHFNLFLDILE